MTDIETIRHEDGRVRVGNGEHQGKAGDGQFLKRATCIVFDPGNAGRNSCDMRAMILRLDPLRSDLRVQELLRRVGFQS